MQQLFNVSEAFSKTLDETRGPNRKRSYLKQVRAWIRPSGARRMVARGLAYVVVGAGIGVIYYFVAKSRNSNWIKEDNGKSLWQADWRLTG